MEFELSLSNYKPESIISRINANEEEVKIDHYFRTVFSKAEQISHITGGAFDITVAPLVNAYGFGFGKKKKLTEAEKLEEGIDILTMLVDSKLCTTRSDARRMVQQGGVSVNGEKVTAIDATFGKADFDDKDRILLKKGKLMLFHYLV